MPSSTPDALFSKDDIFLGSCWVNEESFQMVEQVLGRSLDDVSKCWLDLQTHYGGTHDTEIWYS